MKILLLSLVLYFPSVVFSQIESVDTVRYKSGALEIITKYSNGKVNKTFIYGNGELAYSETYPSIDTTFYVDSSYSISKRNVNGRLEGQRINYFKNDSIQSIHEYSKGIRNGTSRFYNKKGIEIARWQYKNGDLNGTVYYFHENGNPLFIGDYKEDFPTGLRTFYDSLGAPFNGVGKFLLFGETWIVSCNNGIPDGELLRFDESNRLTMIGNYLQGCNHGIFTSYDTTGKISSKHLFLKGDYLSSILEDADASIVGLQKLSVLQPKIIEYNIELFRIYYKKERVDLALIELNKILAIEPLNTDANYNKGVIEFGYNEFEQAKPSFRKVLNVDRKYCKARYNLGLVENELGNDKEAIKNFRKARRCNPELIQANQSIKKIKEQKKRNKQLEKNLKDMYFGI